MKEVTLVYSSTFDDTARKVFDKQVTGITVQFYDGAVKLHTDDSKNASTIDKLINMFETENGKHRKK